ncbi:MAG: helix-turn-helix domain-containing protein [Thermodesulfobacteriota bacterium]
MRQRSIRQETRRLILDAACALFEEKGFRETTVRELAARAGVGLGTIFQHFPDKAALLAEAFLGDVGAELEVALAGMPERDIRAQLGHVARAMYGYYARRPGLSRELASQVYATRGTAGDRLRAQMDDGLERAAGLFAAARARGELRPDADCRAAALAAWSYYVACLNLGLWEPEPNLAAWADRFDSLLGQLLAGIAA